MRGQRETSIDMAEQQDALPLPGRRLGLALRRQPPRLVHDHPVLHQLQQIPLRHRGGEEVALDPPRRQRPLPPLSRTHRLCHAQDATLSSIWHEGLVRDRSASRRVARMDIVTSTCTEKKRYITELAYTRHKLHQSHISTLHNHQE